MAAVLILTSEETLPLVAILAGAGHRVIEVHSSGEALHEVLRRQLDVVTIADNGELVEGVELLPVLRQMTAASIVVVGEGEQSRVAQALFLGADVYLHCPVDADEIRSRIHALVRPRSERRSTNGDPKQFERNRARAPQPYLPALSPVELRLMRALLRRRGGVASPERLAADVWGDGDKRASLRFYIRRLRAKLESHSFLRILNRKGIGYRLQLEAPAALGG
ncbi:MAG: winged helix-turn-helix domain-containing protein [Dehalococcoidia bacterium]